MQIDLIGKARFTVRISRYHDDVAYDFWTNGYTVASRYLAHTIRTIRDLDRAIIIDHHSGGEDYALNTFRRVFGVR